MTLSKSPKFTKISEMVHAIVRALKPGKQTASSAMPKAPLARDPLVQAEHIVLAKRFNMVFCEHLTDFAFVQEKIAPLSYSFVKHRLVLPLEEKEGIYTVA